MADLLVGILVAVCSSQVNGHKGGRPVVVTGRPSYNDVSNAPGLLHGTRPLRQLHQLRRRCCTGDQDELLDGCTDGRVVLDGLG